MINCGPLALVNCSSVAIGKSCKLIIGPSDSARRSVKPCTDTDRRICANITSGRFCATQSDYSCKSTIPNISLQTALTE